MVLLNDLFLQQPFTGPLYCMYHLGYVDRFQYVVNRIQFECFQRIVIKSRHKYDLERKVANALQELKGIFTRHMDIEEYKVGGSDLNKLPGVLRIIGRANDGDIIRYILRQDGPEIVAG